ncbi:MAG TPA: AIR synthase related protein [Flavitalea sp.]|nr:AIR synthase related protein [Flavitalea sp.]
MTFKLSVALFFNSVNFIFVLFNSNENNMSLYSRRGVSAQKEEVHQATEKLDKGLFPHAFCKVYPDYLTNDPGFTNVMHADGAGTKSILAYLYWKETGDLSVWKGIAQDAIVMNLDDLLCAGIHDQILFSSTIDRNKLLIPGAVLETIINGTQEFFDNLRSFGVHIQYLGGETADVGDVVRTIAVNGTMCARWPKEKIITNEKITDGDVIIGFASSGEATYEKGFNSGIGSNGLTSARHDILGKMYGIDYPESVDPALPEEVIYAGSHRLTDLAPNNRSIGSLLLSPTRTYAPLLKDLLTTRFEKIHGLIHCSGGGQTKCMKYLPDNFTIIKDNLFDAPMIFKLIQNASNADAREMYQVFNMGHRLEVFTEAKYANELMEIAHGFNIASKIIGRVEAGKKQLKLLVEGEEILYE